MAVRFLIVLGFRVTVTLNGGPAQDETKELPKHKKNPEIGTKKTVFSSSILVEQEDAASFDENEEVSNFTRRPFEYKPLDI